jgi:hypothetical protein
VVEVGAGPRVVSARVVEGADRDGEVVSGVEVAVDGDWVVAVAEDAGWGPGPVGAAPPAPTGLPAGGGRTWR